MAPKALIQAAGSIVAKEVIKRVTDHKFKAAGRGRRLGGSRRLQKPLEGLKRVVSFGLDKIEASGGVRKIIDNGVAKAKREGFKKVAQEVMNFASLGLVKFVNPSGFKVEFKPDGRFQILFRKESLPQNEQLKEWSELPGEQFVEVTKEEPSDTGNWQYCEIIPETGNLEFKN